MRQLLKRFFRKPVAYLADKYSSKPDKARIHRQLNDLYQCLLTDPEKKGKVIPIRQEDKFIIFSDQHRGTKDPSDDFAFAENNYISALNYYYTGNYNLITLGDCEELWENTLLGVIKANKVSFDAEGRFAFAGRFYKVFGNHDLYWDNDPLASVMLKSVYKQEVKTYEGILLQRQCNNEKLNILLTHGHQGDLQSDGNWFSKWFVANIWAPIQMYLELNLNTPAYDTNLKTEHNELMYEWVSGLNNVLLITGHTHQPVFKSLTLFEKLYHDLQLAEVNNDRQKADEIRKQIKERKLAGETSITFDAYKSSYFNTGCCCYSDGDITGIEIEFDSIRLVKWEYDNKSNPTRMVLEETTLSELLSPPSAEPVNPIQSFSK